MRLSAVLAVVGAMSAVAWAAETQPPPVVSGRSVSWVRLAWGADLTAEVR